MTEPSYQQQMQQQDMPPANLRDSPIDQQADRQPAELQDGDGHLEQPVPPAGLPSRAEQSPYDDVAVSDQTVADPARSDPAASERAVSKADLEDPISDSAESDSRSDERLSTADLAGMTDPSDSPEADADAGSKRALFPEDDANSLRERWRDVQAGFVDEPRRAVQDADALVADLMQRLAESFATERSSLEGQWDRTGDVSTEEMRVALQRYRSFFDRLLSV